MNDVVEVYSAGSTVAIKTSSVVGVIEKIFIGANNAVQYGIICYAPDRHQQIVNAFEIEPVQGKAKKMPIGFCTCQEPAEKAVTVFLDEDNKLLNVDAPTDVLVGTITLTAEEIEKISKKVGMEETNEKEIKEVEEKPKSTRKKKE